MRLCYAGGHWTESARLALHIGSAPEERAVAEVPEERRAPFVWNDRHALRIARHVVFWDVDGGCIVVDTRGRSRFVLERAGSAIWRGLVQAMPHQGVIESLAATYGIHPRTAQEDVDDFIDELVAAGILERQISLGP